VISYGHTATNAADRALCVAPFTHASHCVSLMLSEVAGGGGDSDDEMGDGSRLPAGGSAALSKSPAGSSSSTQLSGRRSVQHMLRQIHDAGERISERLNARDFGARRRLPAVPAEGVHDSDVLTSSQSAQSDGSAEAHLEHRPIRSVLEELPRPSARSPRSLGKSPATESGTSRQLPDPSAMKHCAKNDDQQTPAKPESLKSTDCPPSDHIGMTCKQHLQDLSSTLCSMQVDCQPSPTPLIHNGDFPAEGKQSEKLLDAHCSDVINVAGRHLPGAASESFVRVTAMQQVPISGDMLTCSAEKKPESSKLLDKFAESAADAESEKYTDPSATKHSVPVDCQVIQRQLVYDPQIPVYSVDLMASESWPPENLRCSDGLHYSIPVSNFIGRGVADGESPRNTIDDEMGHKIAVNECPQSRITKSSDVDNLPLCRLCSETYDCRCAVAETDSNAVNSASVECVQTGSNSRKIKTVSEGSLDLANPKCLSMSNTATNGTGFITGNESKNDPKADTEHVNVDSGVELQTHPCQASVTSSDIAEILWSGNGNEGHAATVNDEQSVPKTSSHEMEHVRMASSGLIDDGVHVISDNSFDRKTALNEHLQSLVSFVLHSEKQIPKDIIDSSTHKIKSDGVNESHFETGFCHEASRTSALRASNLDELSKLNTESSKCIVTSPSCYSHMTKANEPFCLAGPRRALSSHNTSSFASSSSAVLKTGGQTLPAAGLSENSTGNVPVKNGQLSTAHVPIITSKNAENTAVVSSATVMPIAVNQRKPGSLSRMACLPPQVRLSTQSPHPPTEPASGPAVAATQARFA